MKRLITLLFIVALLYSCAGSKNYLERSDADKALLDAVKKLNKNPEDENAKTALPILYSNISQRHLANIQGQAANKELGRWDKIINEYEYLQRAYDAIINSPASFKLVNAQSYTTQILEAKQSGAEAIMSPGNH